MNIENYPCDNIRQIEEWEWILERPFFMIERKSLYGLHCFVTGLCVGGSKIFYEDYGAEFNQWLSSELNWVVENSFAYALGLAGGDDVKAFDIWAGWFKTYKAKKKVEAELLASLQEEITKEIDQEVLAELKAEVPVHGEFQESDGYNSEKPYWLRPGWVAWRKAQIEKKEQK